MSRSTLGGSALVAATALALPSTDPAAASEPWSRLGLVAVAVGLWWLLATVAVAVEGVALVLALGTRTAGESARVSLRAAAREVVAEMGGPRDRRRAAGLVAIVAGLGTWAAVMFVATRHLVLHRHDPTLIAVAATLVGLLAAGASTLVGAAVHRGWLAASARLPRAGSQLAVLTTLGATAVLVGVLVWTRHGPTLLDAGAGALLPGLMALLLQLALWLGLPARPARWLALPPWTWALIVPLGLALVVAGARHPETRVALARDHGATAHVHAALLDMADFDRDGDAARPLGRDCAPFDPSIHGLAREVPDNGRDENCDGLDRLPEALDEGTAPVPVAPVGITPNLLLVTVDATRADHAGFMGYARPTTPDLDRLADDAAAFTRAFSQDSGTAPSLWSLMTGKTPFQAKLLRADRFPPAIGPDERMLAELFQEAGFSTHAVLCSSVFVVEHWNLRRGFDDWTELCGRDKGPVAERVADEALPRLRQLMSAEKPFFLWVHFFDPHHPYVDHPDLDFGSRPIDRYDEEIRHAQERVAALLREALETEDDRPLYAAVTSDHGENFGEHGRSQHARTLYREVTHVPLLVWGPDVEARRVDAPVAVGDLYPTLLHLSGLPPPPGCTMTSLVPVLRGAPPTPDRAVFQENSYSRPRRHVKAVIRGRHHLIRDLTLDTWELYDLEKDPEEKENLAGKGVAAEGELKKVIEAFVQTTELPEGLR